MKHLFSLGLSTIFFGFILMVYSFSDANIEILGFSEAFILMGFVLAFMGRKEVSTK